MDIDFISQYTRQNTGRVLVDSGDAYGRVYDRPVEGGLFGIDSYDGMVYVSLTHLIHENAENLEAIQDMLEAAYDDGSFVIPGGFDPRYPWQSVEDMETEDEDGNPLEDRRVDLDASQVSTFGVGPAVMEALGYTLVAEGNTCNEENDLSQDYKYEVWERPDVSNNRGDWYYDRDVVTLIYCHTGCDARWGYAKPLALQWGGHHDYSLPMTLTVGYWPADAATEAWVSERGDNEDRYSQGYSSCPTYDLHDDVGEFLGLRADDGSFISKDSDGSDTWRHASPSQVLVFANPDYDPDDEDNDEDINPPTLTFGVDFFPL